MIKKLIKKLKISSFDKKVIIFYFGFALVHFLLFKFFRLSYFLTYDQVQGSIPLYDQLKEYLLKGQIPLWGPNMYGGMSLFLAGSYDFKTLPFLLFFNSLDLMIAFAGINIAMGGIAFYAMAKKVFNFSDWASLIGSTFWVFQGFLVCYYYDLVNQTSYHWIPVMIIAAVFFAERPKTYFTLMVFGFMSQLFNGRMDCIEMAGIMTLTTLAGYYFFWNGKDKKAWKKLVLASSYLGIAGVTAILILIPFIKDYFAIVEESARYGTGTGAALVQLPLINFINILPNSEALLKVAEGTGQDGYVGLLYLALVVIGLICSTNRRAMLFFFVMGLVYLSLNYDTRFLYIQLFDLYRMLPGHSGLRYPSRFLPGMFLCFSMLLMVGVDTLSLRTKKILNRIRWIFIPTVLLTSALTTYLVYMHRNPLFFSGPTLVSSLMILTLITLGALYTFRNKIKIVGPLMLIYALVSSYLVNFSYVNLPPLHYYARVYENPSGKKAEEFLNSVLVDKSSYRFMAFEKSGYSVGQSYLGHGFQSYIGYQPLSKSVFIYFGHRVFQDHMQRYIPQEVFISAYDLANVKYWLYNRLEAKDNPAKERFTHLKKIYAPEEGDYEIYESPNVFPRSYLAEKVILMSDFYDTVRTQLQSNFSWFKTGVVITADQNFTHWTQRHLDWQEIVLSGGDSKITNYSNTEITLEATSEKGSFLVISEIIDNRRWKALVNGIEEPIVTANGMFRAVLVPPGKSTVIFKYKYPPLTHFLISLLGIIFLCLFNKHTKKITKELKSLLQF